MSPAICLKMQLYGGVLSRDTPIPGSTNWQPLLQNQPRC